MKGEGLMGSRQPRHTLKRPRDPGKASSRDATDMGIPPRPQRLTDALAPAPLPPLDAPLPSHTELANSLPSSWKRPSTEGSQTRVSRVQERTCRHGWHAAQSGCVCVHRWAAAGAPSVC